MLSTKKFPYLVGIGASAGGLDAIQKLFDHIPADTGMAFIIVQHLSPDFKSLMPELLAKHTNMTIFTAEDNQVIEPNCIYLTQRSKNLQVKGNCIQLLDQGPKQGLNLTVDLFFHSLGTSYKDKAIGVILSGTGTDGSRGIKTIKEAGGTIMVQMPSTSQFDGMPNTAIATQLADYILCPEEIGAILAEFPLKDVIIKGLTDSSDDYELVYQAILEEVYKYSGIDFKQYKKNTLNRRIEKRLHVNHLDKLYDYLIFLKNNQSEKELLKQDFLIGVTSFFRDRDAFEQIRTKVLPKLFEQKANSEEPVRIWVVSCSTGEEAYSIAMLLEEYKKEHQLDKDYRIFASDIDTMALQVASTGIYALNSVQEIDREFIEKYFTRHSDSIQIVKKIRDRIVFSSHNILKDTPFIKIDLVTCRNVLIYLNNQSQFKVLTNLLFALNQDGYLFLGSSETLGEMSEYFTCIDAKSKIFQNNVVKKPKPLFDSSKSHLKQGLGSVVSKVLEKTTNADKSAANFHRFLSKEYAPSCIFFDKSFKVLFIKGNAGKHLSLSEGMFESHLLKMVCPQLSELIQTGVKQLEKEDNTVSINRVILNEQGMQVSFDLIFRKTPLNAGLDEAYMIYFNDQPILQYHNMEFQQVSLDEISKGAIDLLDQRLKDTEAELQRTIQELETSTEELQASNEELMASNEELQSTNEELQSVNEELYTVNYELQEKNKELGDLNNYITNLFNSTDVGTLFLDANLLIRNFTPSIRQHFKLCQEDIGRSITSFTSNFKDHARLLLLKHAEKVINDLKPLEDEMQDMDGNYFFCRINPFITVDKKVDGVVLSFIDITEIKKLNLALEQHKRKILEDEIYYRSIVDNNSFYVIKTDMAGNYTYFNNYFCKVFGINPKELMGKSTMSLIIPEDQHLCIETVEKCFAEPDKSFWVILRKPAKKGIEHSQWEFRLLKDSKGEPSEILCIGHEITSLILRHEQLQSLVDANLEKNKRLMQFTHIISHNIRSHVSNLKGIVMQVDRNPDKDNSSYWDLIKKTTNALDETILNLNESITIQANVNIPMKDNSLQEKISIVKNSLSSMIEEQNVVIKYQQITDDDLIYANSAYLDSILLNLISNAIKYRSETRDPEITISLSSTSEFRVLTVKDNGIGIDLKKHGNQLFGMFKTFHHNKDAKGFGLFITKVQVESMKGRIEAESIPGLGSNFVVYFPINHQYL